MAFEKPFEGGTTPSVGEDSAAAPKVGGDGVLGSEMLSQSMSTSASSSSHALQDRKSCQPDFQQMFKQTTRIVYTSAELKPL